MVRRIGKGMVPVIAAGTALLYVFGGLLPERAVYAEDQVVVEDAPADDYVPADGSAPVSEEAPAGSVDPAQVEGLFEVVSEKSGYDGEKADDKSGKDKKKKKKEKKLIVGYRQVGVQASIRFEMGEKPSLDRLRQQFPSQLDVYFLGEKKPETVPVTWESYGDDYSSTNLNYYFFTPRFDSDKYEVKGMNLQSESPYIEVIQNAFTYEMIESAPPKENEAAVVRFCMDKLRLNTAATCGILANIYCESGFRTNAIGDGGTSVGICQWHNSRWTNLRNYAPDEWQTLDGQLSFMRKELLGRYRGTLDYLRAVTDDEQGAYDAAYYWCMHYEMPDKIVSRSTTRGYLAKNVYWKRYGLGEEETESEIGEPGTESETGKPETESETDKPSEETETEALTGETQAEPETDKPSEETETEALTEEIQAEPETEKPSEETETEALTEEIQAEPETEIQTEEAGTEPEQISVDPAAEDETEAYAGEAETEEEKMKTSFAGTYRCISEDGLFIREARSTESSVAGLIPFEGMVSVYSADGEWARVGYDGKEGFSKLEFLEKIPEETEGE